MSQFTIFPRRLKWKIGRRLYMTARGDPLSNLPNASDERYIQRSVLSAASSAERMTILDVGGNKGQWSSQLLKLAIERQIALPNLAIHAFEPVPESRELYIQNVIGSFDSPQVELHSNALSNEIGKAQIAIWGQTSGINSLSFDPTSSAKANKFLEIETTTLDEFIKSKSIEHISLVKIDVEGHDFKVLQGAEKTLKEEHVDVLQFEYSHRWIYSRTFLRDVFRFAEELPYSICRIRSNRLERLQKWHPELERFFDANFALVHPRAEGWFDIHDGRFDESNTYA